MNTPISIFNTIPIELLDNIFLLGEEKDILSFSSVSQECSKLAESIFLRRSENNPKVKEQSNTWKHYYFQNIKDKKRINIVKNTNNYLLNLVKTSH